MNRNHSKLLCTHCIEDINIKKLIKNKGKIGKCNYCDKRRISLPLDEVAELVHERIGEIFPYKRPIYEMEEGGQTPQELISEMLKVEYEEISEDIRAILSDEYDYRAIQDGDELQYNSDTYYDWGEFYPYGHTESWTFFCKEVKHGSRFFSPYAERILGEIFSNLEEYKTYEGKKLIREIDSQDSDRFFYRARRINNQQEIAKFCIHPRKELGPPPKNITPSGRMNSSGIPVFYGSFDRETCVSEIRVSVGAFAITGKFELINPIKVLDLTVVEEGWEDLSYFDENFKQIVEHRNFLDILHREISRPIQPSDQAIDYVPTQVVAEFLNKHYQPNLDGIIYRSSQIIEAHEDEFMDRNECQVGRNIVIFSNKAKIQLPNVNEDINQKKSQFQVEMGENFCDLVDPKIISSDTHLFNDDDQSGIKPTICFVEDSLEIQEVLSIKYNMKTRKISIIRKE